MPTASVSAVITAPIEKVWEIVGDLSAQPRWNNVHVGFPKGVPSPVTVNATFTQTITNMGLPNDIAWTVSEYEPERVLEARREIGARLLDGKGDARGEAHLRDLIDEDAVFRQRGAVSLDDTWLSAITHCPFTFRISRVLIPYCGCCCLTSW